MPLFYQQNINETTRLGVWKIAEDELFFLQSVPLQQNITHPIKRLQHLAGRFLLAFLFPDFPMADIEIAATRKPFLQTEQYHFSISHCSSYAAAIVSSTQRVGIDIEMITPRVEKIKHKFLHEAELAFVHSHPVHQQIALLTLLWSAKEAMFKWWGNGEVDFSEVMRIHPFIFSKNGIIPAIFMLAQTSIVVDIHYEMQDTYSLAWIAS